MRLQKLVQARDINEDVQDETVERQKRHHGEPERQLDEKEHNQRNGYQQREKCLHFGQDQDIESQQSLRQLLQLEPFALEQDLNEALIPARALLDELLDRVRRLLARHKLIVVDDAHARVREAQADAEVGVFRQAGLVPAAELLHQFAAHKDGIAAQRRHTDARKKVHGRFEPEEIFQHIEETEPFRIMVHQLHPALHHVHILVEHGRIDDVENVRVRLVLGIEDGHDIAMRDLQGQVEAVRLIDRRIVEDHQLHVGIAKLFNFGLRLRNGAGVILATDRQYLHQLFWIVQIIDFLDRFTIDRLFMARRKHDGKRKARVAVNGWRVIEPGVFRLLPDKKAQADIKDGLHGHQ